MNVLVTGATGFLGGHLCEGLSDLGHVVIGLIHDGHSGLDRKLAHWVFGNVSDLALLRRTISDYECGAVVHLAAITQVSVALADPLSAFEANIRGTWTLLEACKLQNVGRVIIASTDKVYGRSSAPYTEGTALLPDRPYETSKACADMIARTYASSYGMSIAVTRSVNLYGPGHLNWSTLIPGTIRRLVRGETPILTNGGTPRRDFLFVGDLADGYSKLLESDYVGPICFGTGRGWRIREVVDRIQAIMGTSKPPVGIEDKGNELDAQWSDFDLAKRTLGWAPIHGLESGLRETVPWYVKYLGADK